jgi:hypothetical protein
MTVDQVITKLSLELASITGDSSHVDTYRRYIQMALSVGREHFNDQMNEIVAYDLKGNQVGRFKGVRDAGRKLNIDGAHIRRVIRGERHSHKGFIFRKDTDLVKKTA